MEFDEVIERRATHSMKWDMMEPLFGVPKGDGIAMWVADMDFRPVAAAGDALRQMVEHGIYGYYGDDASYRAAIAWWMQARHGWEIRPEWIFTTHGLVNGTALCIDAYSEPGDSIVLFTPVYHAFARVIRAAGRNVAECPLAEADGRYGFDFAAHDRQMTGREKLAILCSPQNPGGQVWSRSELKGVADFCERHDLILLADEIHHDLLMPGQSHVPMPLAAPEAAGRLVMMTATTKTFNIAGAHVGNVIIPDDRLRETFGRRMAALGMSPNSFGLMLAEAVYSPEGAEWVDRLMTYLDANRRMLDDCLNSLTGVRSMPLQATYLAWADFRGTGLEDAEVLRRIEQVARIAVNRGATFGSGGEGRCRFNFATPRSRLEEAMGRLERAFSKR